MAHKWLMDYLSNREQYVKFNNCMSDSKPVRIGVPQGSILGPLLFLIFIEDIKRAGHEGELLLFADDGNYYESSDNHHQLIELVNCKIHFITRWFLANRLAINVIKTEAMLFSRRLIYFPLQPIIVNSCPIPYNFIFKFLGVLLDFKLNWKAHICSISSKLSSACGILFRTRNMITRNIAKTIYYGIAHPYLTYCNIVWGSCYPSNLQRLVTIQKKLIRLIIRCNRRTPTTLLFKQLKILKLRDITNLSTSIFVFKAVNYLIDSPITFLNRNDVRYNLRNQHNIDIPVHRSRQAELFIHVRGARLWNGIPLAIRNRLNVYSFKHHLKMHYLNLYQ